MDIRTATRDDLEVFGAWADAEGWLPGRDDLDPFYAADPGGFHVGVEDGRIVATISVVRYGATFAFLGFYIVAPDRRGQGLGRRLWDAGMATVPDHVVGLDGVAEQVPAYEQSGFAFSHWTTRFTGTCGDVAQALEVDGGDTWSGVRQVESDPGDVEALLGYDSRHVPAGRPEFLRSWLADRTRRRTYVAVVDGSVTGYATVRPSTSGAARVGPLFADTDAVARSLLARCARDAAAWSDELCVDVPERNDASTRMVQGLGMSPAFACARMYRGPAPNLPYRSIYGSTTFELG